MNRELDGIEVFRAPTGEIIIHQTDSLDPDHSESVAVPLDQVEPLIANLQKEAGLPRGKSGDSGE